jgi:hypothetical protein
MFPNQGPPEGWPRPRRSAMRILSAVGFSLLTLITAAVAVSAVATGDGTQAVTSAVGVLLFGHLAGMSISFLRRPRPAAGGPRSGANDRGETGMAFPYAIWPYYWLSAVLVLVALFAVGFAVLLATSGTAAGWVFSAVAAAFAIFVGWFLVVVLRLAPGRIVLTPAGIYQRSLVLEHFVPWDAVVDVLAREGPNPWITVKAMPSSATRERRYTGRLGSFETQALPFMISRAYWLGPNALPAYLAVRYYFEHAEERSKLGEIPEEAGL